MHTNYHIVRIQQYLNGELNREEMYELEREALDDPFLQEAIDGYRMQQEVSHRRLSLLQRRLADRIAHQAQERNAFYFGWQRLAVAATACVLMVLVLVLLWMRSQPIHSVPAEKEVLVELAPIGGKTVHVSAVDSPGFDGHPRQGWQQYNVYLAQQGMERVLTGRVTVTFEVGADGKPMAITADDATDPSLLAEVKRLLENGPAWDGTKAKVSVATD